MLTLNKLTFKSESEVDTITLARLFSYQLKGHETIVLSGDLACGKTTFTKGLAMGLNIKETVKSPTFTICKEYSGKYPLYHFDLYRLNGLNGDFNLTELIGEGIVCVEWAENAPEFLPPEYIMINFRVIENGNRLITIDYFPKWKELCNAVSRN